MIYESTRKATREELIERIKELEEENTKLKYLYADYIVGYEDGKNHKVTATQIVADGVKCELCKQYYEWKIRELIQKLDIDIERNKRRINQIERDPDGAYIHHLIAYEPEAVKRILEELLKDGGEYDK